MSDLEEIKILDSGVADGVNAGSGAKVAEYYAEDASIHPPGGARMDGKADIAAYWQGGIDAGLSNVSIVATSIDIHGDTSITVGTLSGTMGDADLTGKYIVIGTKTSDGWKIKQDIWNFDA